MHIVKYDILSHWQYAVCSYSYVVHVFLQTCVDGICEFFIKLLHVDPPSLPSDASTVVDGVPADVQGIERAVH